MSTEDKRSKIEKAKAMTKEAKNALKRIGKKVVDEGKEFVKDHAAEGAMALALGGASLNANEAQAQTYDQFRNAPEMHISSNGTVTMSGGARQTTTTVRQSGGTASFQAARMRQQQQMVSRVNIYGEEIVVPAQIKHKSGILVYSEAFSFGLKGDYVAAYINPNQVSPDPFERSVYYAQEMLDGRLQISVVHNQEHVYEGGGPYAMPLKDRKAILLGRGPMVGGGVVYAGGDQWDMALDQVNHTMDQVDYAIGTAARIGETVGDILHIGNRVGGYIKREAKRGMGKAPSGVRRSPSGRGGRR